MRALSEAIFDIDEGTKMEEWAVQLAKGMTEADLQDKPKAWWRRQAAVKWHVPMSEVLVPRMDAVFDKFKDAVDLVSASMLFTYATFTVHTFQMRIIKANGISGK
jgi:broad specificity phosphatase PhoE